MTDQDQTFIIEMLKRIQADVADIKRGQWNLTERVSSVEQQTALIRQDLVRIEHRLDGIDNRLERVEVRLDLREEAP